MAAPASNVSSKRFRVGIVGLQPGRSWGAIAHVPALRALASDFVVTGVANSTRESSEAAAKALDIPQAFASVDELIASPEVDIVAVTVKVPHHAGIVRAALAAGKHIFCEWPLGNGLDEARELATLAERSRLKLVVGTQAVFAPEVIQLRNLVANGYVGKCLSTTLVGTGMAWGPITDSANEYINDIVNGATMLTIPVCHTLAAIVSVLGPIEELSAVLSNGRSSAVNYETGATVAMTAHDQVLVAGVLRSGAPISVHYRGGSAHGSGATWEVNGTDGELRIHGANGMFQLTELQLSGARGDDTAFKAIGPDADQTSDASDGPIVGNVRRVYAAMAQDLRSGTRLAPSAGDAIELHQTVAAVEKAARTGQRVKPADM